MATALGFSIETFDETGDPVQALAEQYLSIPCSVMSPNPGRMEMLTEMI